MATWGDSLTFGQGANAGLSYPDRLTALLNRYVSNGGVAGETSTQIATRMIAAADLHRWPTIIWAGRNNITAEATVEADVASMVAALGHSNYIVISVTNGENVGEYIGATNYNHIIAINASLAATYGSHYLDVRSYLVSLYDPNNAQDVIDHGHDIPPSSLRFDVLHFNAAGYQAIANYVYTRRAQLGFN